MGSAIFRTIIVVTQDDICVGIPVFLSRGAHANGISIDGCTLLSAKMVLCRVFGRSLQVPTLSTARAPGGRDVKGIFSKK